MELQGTCIMTEEKETEESLSTQFWNRLQGEAKSPSFLFHYTTVEGLLGIISSQVLWATEIRCLNDTLEYEYTINLAREVLKEFRPHFESSAGRAVFDLLEQALGVAAVIPLYTVSFSEHPDQLSQWRAYGRNGGYAMGLSPDAIRATIGRVGDLPGALFKCSYHSEKQREHLKYVLQCFLKLVDEVRENPKGRESRLLARCHLDFASHLTAAAAVFKHPSFTEEAEWRLIIRGIPGAHGRKFRRRGEILAPYIEVPLADEDTPLTLASVILGPNPDMALAKLGVKALLEENAVKMPFEGIRESTVPYRDW
jgi:hypothetical protein